MLFKITTSTSIATGGLALGLAFGVFFLLQAAPSALAQEPSLQLAAPLITAPPAATAPQTPLPTQFIPFGVPTTRLAPLPGQNQANTQADATQLLLLSDSLNFSLEKSPRMASVRALLGTARSAYYKATELPNPGLYMAKNYGNSYYLGASIPIEPPWKLYFRLLIAKNQLQQAKLDVTRSLWLFRGEVRRNYALMVIAQEVVTARQKLADLAMRMWQTTKTQFDNGNAPGLDVRRSKLAYIQAKMDLEQALIGVDQAREQLNLIMGRPADGPILVPPLPDPNKLPTAAHILPDFARPFASRETFIEQARQNRIELKSAKQAILTNEANLKNAYGNILPTPRFVVGALKENNAPSGPVDHTAFFQTYADAPIFNFQQGDITRFRAAAVQLKLDQKAQENIVAGQVAMAYRKLIAARQRLKVFQEEALPEADAVSSVSKHGFELGQTDLNTTLDAQRAHIQTLTQYLDAVLTYQLAINDLEQAVGVPLE